MKTLKGAYFSIQIQTSLKTSVTKAAHYIQSWNLVKLLETNEENEIK